MIWKSPIIKVLAIVALYLLLSSKHFWFLVGAVGIGLCIYACRKRWISFIARAKYLISGTAMTSTAIYASGLYTLLSARCVNTYALALQHYSKLRDKIYYVLSSLGIG